MTQILKKHESLVRNGKIKSFTVCFHCTGITIKPANGEQEQKVTLVSEILDQLKLFFCDVNSIEYGSFDYTNLICFLNAQPIHAN